jgi:hypothetical protein
MSSAYGDTRLARRLLWCFGTLDAVLLFAALCGAANGQAGWLVVLLPLLVASVVVGGYALQQGLLFELLLEHTWQAVCKGIGFVGEGRARLQTGVSYDFYGSVKKTKVVRTKIYPRLRSVRGDRQGWTAVVTPFAGQTIEDYNKHAPAFSLAFHVAFVGFDLAENGLIRIRAGKVPVPPAYDFEE